MIATPLHGRVTGVTPLDLGDEASTASAADALTVTVDDGSDFDEDGGHVLINGEVYAYMGMEYVGDAADEGDPAVLTLATGLLAAVAEGDRVDVWDPNARRGAGAVAVEYVATLASDSSDVAGDPFEADVDHRLVPLLREGIRADGSESVELERNGDDLRVVRVLGKTAEIGGEYVRSPLALGYLLADASLVNDTWTTVMWTIESTAEITYDAGTGKFTVQTTGIYDFRFGAKFAGGTGSRIIQPQFETLVGNFAGREVRIDAGGVAVAVETSQLKNLLAGERIYFEVKQTSGAALALKASDTTVALLRVGATT